MKKLLILVLCVIATMTVVAVACGGCDDGRDPVGSANLDGICQPILANAVYHEVGYDIVHVPRFDDLEYLGSEYVADVMSEDEILVIYGRLFDGYDRTTRYWPSSDIYSYFRSDDLTLAGAYGAMGICRDVKCYPGFTRRDWV